MDSFLDQFSMPSEYFRQHGHPKEELKYSFPLEFQKQSLLRQCKIHNFWPKYLKFESLMVRRIFSVSLAKPLSFVNKSSGHFYSPLMETLASAISSALNNDHS